MKASDTNQKQSLYYLPSSERIIQSQFFYLSPCPRNIKLQYNFLMQIILHVTYLETWNDLNVRCLTKELNGKLLF
jgi:hypothetical protein